MIDQNLCQKCNGMQVSTEFLLMGLISEEPASKTGFYSSGITIDKARTAVEALQERSRQADGLSLSSPAPELPFSRDAKRVFESAAEVLCSIMWHFVCTLAFASVGTLSYTLVPEEHAEREGGKDIWKWC